VADRLCGPRFSAAVSEIYLRYGSERQVLFRAGSGLFPRRWPKPLSRVFTAHARSTFRDGLSSLRTHRPRPESRTRTAVYEDALTFIAQTR